MCSVVSYCVVVLQLCQCSAGVCILWYEVNWLIDRLFATKAYCDSFVGITFEIVCVRCMCMFVIMSSPPPPSLLCYLVAYFFTLKSWNTKLDCYILIMDFCFSFLSAAQKVVTSAASCDLHRKTRTFLWQNTPVRDVFTSQVIRLFYDNSDIR